MTGELLLWHERDEAWALLREGGRPVELRVECPHRGPAVGSIVKGRVVRVLPGIQAAFVDIGGERNGFLQGVDSASVGDGVLVQVEREALAEKGPRLTTSPSVAGWHLVLLTADTRRSVSRRIRDATERERLLPLVKALPGEHGFIARTTADGVDEAALRREAEALAERWRVACERAAGARAPCVVEEGPDLALRALHAAGAGLDRIVVDDAATRDRLVAFLDEVGSSLATDVQTHADPDAQRRELRGVVEKLLRPRVWLRSGGYVVIESTEALTSVDVNSGKFLGKGGAAQSAVRTNREAAAEVARQLRLRDIGGLVVVDFIQMEGAADRRDVLNVLRESFARDPGRTRVAGFSEFGLVELARTRARESPEARLDVPCPHCAGRGRVRR